MPRCEVYMHVGLLDAFPKNTQQRRKIMDFIRSLREHPDAPGDFTDRDASLRERQIKIISNHAITYWLDAPVNIVMVVDVCPADR